MNIIPLCDPYFYEDPKVLVGSAWWRRWTRTKNTTCASEVANEIVAVYLFTAIFASVVAFSLDYVATLPIAFVAATLYLIPAFFSYLSLRSWESCTGTKREGFEPQVPVSNVIVTPAETYAKPLVTDPTAQNPFMNVLINQIKYDPKRPPAANVTAPRIGDPLDAFFRVQWLSDPTDVFGRTQSQRQFITMPSTTIPNDQDSYQNWLYRIPGKTCKEGGREACLPGTDGAVVPWLSTNA
jgi:hypothetical protein